MEAIATSAGSETKPALRTGLKAALVAFAANLALLAPSHSQPASPPEIKFDAKSFLQLPKDMYLGEVSGVAVNKQGHLFVFNRGNTSGPAYGAAAAQLLEFDKTGKFVREIGKHLYAWSFSHDVRVDPQGNIWAADKGSDMVIRFNPAGRVTMVFGRKVEAADEGAHPLEHPRPPLPAVDGMFRQVTDMAWDSKGNTYISDGYINSRVAKASKDGQWLKSWGSFGSEPGQFNTVHAIAVDAQDRVYVADRGNRRIQVFDTEGKLLKIITINVPFPADAPTAIGNPAKLQADGFSIVGAAQTQAPGAPWTLCITPPGPHGQVLYVSDSWPGRIYKLDLDGKVLGWLGGSGKQIGQFGWIHEIACPSENELYVAELLNWRVQKLHAPPVSIRRKSHKVALGLLGALCAASLAHAQAQPDFAKVQIKAQKVAEGFYVIDETEVHGGAVSVLAGPDGVLMVDTGAAGLADKVEAEIRKVSPLPVRYVINTHAHVDEIGGNEHFAHLGATLIGRDLMRTSMLHPRALPPGADGRQVRQVHPPSEEAAPKLTFKTEMGLHFNGQDIRLIAVPRAHTDCDAIIVLPGLDIVVVGDVLRAGEFPSIGRPDGGTLKGMIEGVDALIALGGPKTRFVTSHGQVVGRDAVIAQRNLLLTSRDRVAARIAEGQSLDQIVAAKVTEGLGAQAQPGHISAEAFVRDVYNELKSAG